jgi:4-aminobutyrate aminotransferase-like enzyme
MVLKSPTLQTAIDVAVDAVMAACADITAPRGSDPNRVARMDNLMERLSDVRGRGGFYASLGSGRGRGALIELEDGSVKWDMITGIGVHGFGHSDPDLIRAAIQAAMQDTVMQGNLQCNEEAIHFAEVVRSAARRGGADMAHCYPACSGAMANENAMKVCMQARPSGARVLAFRHNFIGRTLSLSQIGDSAGHREGLPETMEVDLLPFWDPTDGPASTERAVHALGEAMARCPDAHACFVMELVQGEGGFNVAPRDFFVPLLDICKEAGIPIWFDEIQTFGRTETMFRFEGLDLGQYADVITIGKMAQGCAALWRANLNPRPGLLSGTYLGSTAAMTVGATLIERLGSGDWYGSDGRNATLHGVFHRRATELIEAHPECFPEVPGTNGPWPIVGGIGGMMRLTPFAGDKARIASIVKNLFDAGVISFFCGHGPFHLRFLPPIGALTPAELELIMDIVGEVILAEQGRA